MFNILKILSKHNRFSPRPRQKHQFLLLIPRELISMMPFFLMLLKTILQQLLQNRFVVQHCMYIHAHTVTLSSVLKFPKWSKTNCINNKLKRHKNCFKQSINPAHNDCFNFIVIFTGQTLSVATLWHAPHALLMCHHLRFHFKYLKNT